MKLISESDPKQKNRRKQANIKDKHGAYQNLKKWRIK